MKKFILTALSAVLLLSSCIVLNDQDTYSITNLSDFVTVQGESLITDYGTVLTVREDKTDKAWKNDGGRLYALFDVIDRQLSIRLKSYTPVMVQAIDPAYKPGEDELPGDPVEIALCGFSAKGYLNLIIGYYSKKDTECPHNVKLGYIESEDKAKLTFCLYHDGEGENPTAIDATLLEHKYRAMSFPIDEIIPSGETRNVYFQADFLGEDNTIQRKTARMYETAVQF
ncbi:MAG: hypothetical protein J5835_07505 [Bacteroidales bacterium]|nr:hypothetical protein [Bacteroidales bacterium]